MSTATLTDFAAVRSYTLPMERFIEEWNPDREALARHTNASIDRFLELLDGLSDEEVTFVPDDPDAADHAAADPTDLALAWTIAHVIVHATASGDEYSSTAAELARGVDFHGRTRYETPWQQVTTVAQCRQRLEESRRIRLASLQMWPDSPHLAKGYTPWKASGWVNAQGIFAWGLSHDESHHEQVAQIREQVLARR